MAGPAEPENPRRLGRSRAYVPPDLPERLRHWHAPRVNRWERLAVTTGVLVIERLDPDGMASERFASGASRWFAPGQRWRIADLTSDARFELEVHAEAQSGSAPAPTLRSALLDEAERVALDSPAAIAALLAQLSPGERRLIKGGFDAGAALAEAMRSGDGRLFWHPLASGTDRFAGLVGRSRQRFGLGDYLGRDHAVIEAALAGALRGDDESGDWLRNTLTRHLAIEETLVFPAYVAAGGRDAWVRGLEREHGYLRQYITQLGQPDGQRKFLRLLDGHDEKEERVVYPDILARLGPRAAALLARTVAFPIPFDGRMAER